MHCDISANRLLTCLGNVSETAIFPDICSLQHVKEYKEHGEEGKSLLVLRL